MIANEETEFVVNFTGTRKKKKTDEKSGQFEPRISVQKS